LGPLLGPGAREAQKTVWGGSRARFRAGGPGGGPKEGRKEAKIGPFLAGFWAPSGPQKQEPRKRQPREGQGPQRTPSGGQAPPTPPRKGGGEGSQS